MFVYCIYVESSAELAKNYPNSIITDGKHTHTYTLLIRLLLDVYNYYIPIHTFIYVYKPAYTCLVIHSCNYMCLMYIKHVLYNYKLAYLHSIICVQLLYIHNSLWPKS